MGHRITLYFKTEGFLQHYTYIDYPGNVLTFLE